MSIVEHELTRFHIFINVLWYTIKQKYTNGENCCALDLRYTRDLIDNVLNLFYTNAVDRTSASACWLQHTERIRLKNTNTEYNWKNL